MGETLRVGEAILADIEGRTLRRAGVDHGDTVALMMTNVPST